MTYKQHELTSKGNKDIKNEMKFVFEEFLGAFTIENRLKFVWKFVLYNLSWLRLCGLETTTP